MTTKRTRPLTAAAPVTISVDDPLLVPSHADARAERFDDGVRTLRIGSASNRFSGRILLFLGGFLAPAGIVVVLLGWYGASHTAYSFEQLPYVISGGLLGLSLVFVGCFFYFAHWLTQLVKEHREQSAAIIAAIERLTEAQHR